MPCAYLSFEPEEPEDGPAEPEADGLRVAVVQLQEEEDITEGQFVRVELGSILCNSISAENFSDRFFVRKF
jgi:uncharacterized protein (UPF0212 family)